MMLERLLDRVRQYFFTVPRMETLAGANVLDVEGSAKLLRPHGLRITSANLCRDLSLLALGADLRNRYDVEANITFELRKRMPWWLRIVPGVHRAASARLTKAHLREWLLLELLSTVQLPGATFRRKYISAVILYLTAKQAIYQLGMPFDEVRQWLSKVTRLAQTVSEHEQTLLEALPDDATMSELPPMLQAQFDAAKEDAELFFSGEEYRAAYAVGKAVRRLIEVRERKLVETGSHVFQLEQLLSHPGRAIVLETSRELEQFQAFVLEKLREFQPDPRGDEMRFRPLRDASELRLARTSSLALSAVHPPLFWKRVADRGVDVREYGFIEEERPRAHLLIDKSPSMLFFGRLFKAGGVLFNRLLGTLQGNADVTFQLFDERTASEIVIDGPYEAQQVMTMIRMANFVGSGTDIDKALRSAIAGIRKLPRRRTPDHLILVSDGKAKVTLDAAECEHIKLHCFLLGGSNPELRSLVQQTEGVYQEC
ncbi:MAG: VWA domain-containing protein [Bdellovibrionales bacterium]|nr:VWA domain-containing protein [Bdellovibrionales bacterium]